MKLSEIKEAYAKEKGYLGWFDFTQNYAFLEEFLNEIAIRYAKAKLE